MTRPRSVSVGRYTLGDSGPPSTVNTSHGLSGRLQQLVVFQRKDVSNEVNTTWGRSVHGSDRDGVNITAKRK